MSAAPSLVDKALELAEMNHERCIQEYDRWRALSLAVIQDTKEHGYEGHAFAVLQAQVGQ